MKKKELSLQLEILLAHINNSNIRKYIVIIYGKAVFVTIKSQSCMTLVIGNKIWYYSTIDFYLIFRLFYSKNNFLQKSKVKLKIFYKEYL